LASAKNGRKQRKLEFEEWTEKVKRLRGVQRDNEEKVRKMKEHYR
jgi:hypothetical protein